MKFYQLMWKNKRISRRHGKGQVSFQRTGSGENQGVELHLPSAFEHCISEATLLPSRGQLIPGELVTETTYPKWQSTEGVSPREEEMVCIKCLFV